MYSCWAILYFNIVFQYAQDMLMPYIFIVFQNAQDMLMPNIFLVLFFAWWEKNETGGRRWRGLGWRAFAGLWFRCASTTGRAGRDDVSLLDATRFCVPQPRPLSCCLRLVTVVAVTKSRLPRVGPPTLGSVVVRRTAGAGYPKTTPNTYAPARCKEEQWTRGGEQ